ncbi:MFS transporter [Patulibacter sp. SYSU D01012]|uniref:MFS transporter n=1 Tax=Patulibacter sp. SYSU D01012 TaxID=2817381 RepID=UPI001B308F29|nr:MFS transporter [Patulibacter sp. SYSU D01012]
MATTTDGGDPATGTAEAGAPPPPDAPDAAADDDGRLLRGSEGYRRLSVAMFAAGLATFALLYTTQPLLPLLTRDLHVSPAASSLTLSVTTGALALGLLPAGWLSDAVGRMRVMSWSLLLSGVLALVAAAAPSFATLLVVRALQGLALAGLPAVAMAYLTEEVHPTSLGSSIGLYIGGNALGGMGGRLVGGALADVGGWRVSLLGVGVLSLLCTAVFLRLVPGSRYFHARPFRARETLTSLRGHLEDRGQLRLDAMAALLMGTFVAVFNALGFRLEAAPYGLGQTAIAAVFLVYPVGSVASAVSGRLADRIGRRTMLPVGVLLAAVGLALTLLHPLPVVILGVATLTAGFFAAHSVASSWVGRRAVEAPAQASALYLLAYYAGSSVAGPLGGTAWTAGRWTGVVLLGAALLGLALLVSLRLRVTPPLRRAAEFRPHASA